MGGVGPIFSTFQNLYPANIQNPKNKNISESIENVIEQMLTKYNYKWTISTLANQCNLSTDWFMHKFKGQTGLSLMDLCNSRNLCQYKYFGLSEDDIIKSVSAIKP